MKWHTLSIQQKENGSGWGLITDSAANVPGGVLVSKHVVGGGTSTEYPPSLATALCFIPGARVVEENGEARLEAIEEARRKSRPPIIPPDFFPVNGKLDERLQRVALGLMLINPNNITANCSRSKYFDGDRVDVFFAIRAVYIAVQPVDPGTVALELERRGYLEKVGGVPYIARLETEAMKWLEE